LATGEPYPIPAAGLHNQIVRIEVRMYYKQSVLLTPKHNAYPMKGEFNE